MSSLLAGADIITFFAHDQIRLWYGLEGKTSEPRWAVELQRRWLRRVPVEPPIANDNASLSNSRADCEDVAEPRPYDVAYDTEESKEPAP